MCAGQKDGPGCKACAAAAAQPTGPQNPRAKLNFAVRSPPAANTNLLLASASAQPQAESAHGRTTRPHRSATRWAGLSSRGRQPKAACRRDDSSRRRLVGRRDRVGRHRTRASGGAAAQCRPARLVSDTGERNGGGGGRGTGARAGPFRDRAAAAWAVCCGNPDHHIQTRKAHGHWNVRILARPRTLRPQAEWPPLAHISRACAIASVRRAAAGVGLAHRSICAAVGNNNNNPAGPLVSRPATSGPAGCVFRAKSCPIPSPLPPIWGRPPRASALPPPPPNTHTLTSCPPNQHRTCRAVSATPVPQPLLTPASS